MQRLIVGLDAAPPPPMQLGAPGTPEFRGLEVDLLTAVAATLGRKLVYEVELWSQLLHRLVSGRIDLVCTAATVTPARKQQFAFSRSYLPSALVLVSRDGTGIRGPRDVEHTNIAVRVATVADEWATAHLPTARPVRFDLNTEAYQALLHGAVDALVDDHPIARFFVSTTPGLRIVAAIPGTDAEYAMVFARGNDALRIAVDQVLLDMKRRGQLRQLRQKWLGES
jgi:ABC-type amino acid transport substrate-binding protein